MGAAHTGPGFQDPVFGPVSVDDPATVSGHRISARLGAGAQGVTYLAHAPGGQPLALTVIRPETSAAPEFAARFHRDAQAAGRVRGPFLVPVVGSGNEGARYWLAAAYVPGLSLRAAVAAGGPLPTGVVLRLVAGLAEALQAVHHAGVVHGGLRPSHVLLAADGPRLKSYGLGWLGEGEEATAFRSPEQAAGKAAVPATDVFALGQIAAYASIGAAPFGDGARVQHAEADLNELPGQLREIVTRCLIKDPALRPSLAQITTMCAQAAPERPRATSWLPAPLLAAILPTIPPPTVPVPPARPGMAPAPAPVQPPAPGRPPGAPAGPPNAGMPTAPPSPPTPPGTVGGRPSGGPVTPVPDTSFLPAAASSAAAEDESRTVTPSTAADPKDVGPSAVRPEESQPAAVATPHPAQPAAVQAPPAATGAVPPSVQAGGSGSVQPHVAPPLVQAPPAATGAVSPPVQAGGPGPAQPHVVPPPVQAAPQAPPHAGPPGPPGAPPRPQHPAPGGYLLHPQQWPRAPYVHVPLPLPRKGGRRGAVGAVAVVAGLALAVTAGVVLVGGFDESRGGRPAAQGPASPSAGQGAPAPTESPSPPGGGATGAPEPEEGSSYQGVRLPAGYGVTFRADPPIVRAGTFNGDFGFTARADAFTVQPHRGTLALLTPQDPTTLGACRTTVAAQVTSVARTLVSVGDRLCVHSMDGTTTMVTVRQLTALGAPEPSAVLDLMVWRPTTASPTPPITPTVTLPVTPTITPSSPGVTALSTPADRLRVNFSVNFGVGVARHGSGRVY